MTRRRSAWLAALVLPAALIAGCGSSSSSTSTSAPSTSSSAAGTSSAIPPANVAQAVEACKKLIQNQSALPASAKAKLEGVCEKAAKGDGEAVKKAAREVCEEVIKNSPVPAGVAQEQALAACKAK